MTAFHVALTLTGFGVGFFMYRYHSELDVNPFDVFAPSWLLPCTVVYAVILLISWITVLSGATIE